MKVAIMGAGLSGLACAITLENQGIYPSIYEKRSQVGDRFVNGEIMLSILTHPIYDPIVYLSENYGIQLHPTASIHKMTICSKNGKAIIEGSLGFSNIRGREQEAYEAQLSRQVKTPIHFNSDKTYEYLVQNYTHVIMATGDGQYSKELRNYREDLTVSLIGATVEGSFDKFSVITWLDSDLAPKGYGYLIPYSDKEANIVIAFPDHPDLDEQKCKRMWKQFYERVTEELNQSLRITDSFHINHYPIGICHSAKIGNTFFVGNCFGTTMPYLGFGQFESILSGIFAAYELCGFGNYEDMTNPLRQSYENSLVLRRSMEMLSNDHYDQIVHLLSGRLGDKLFNTKHFNLLKIGSFLLRPYVKFKTGR